MGSVTFSATSGYDITPHKDLTMKSNMVIVVLVQLMLVCTLLDGQAAAMDYDNDPDQLWKIDRELFQDCLKQRDPLHVKHHRIVRPPERVRIYANLQQDDLLRELLAPEVIRHGLAELSLTKELVTDVSQAPRQSLR